MRISVVDTKDDKGVVERRLEGPIAETSADPRHIYCLNYLSSPTSEDIVQINRTNEGILQSVSTDILDQSRFIAIELVRALFTLLSGLPATDLRANTVGTTEKVSNLLRYELDPFDFSDTATLNARLKDLGYCMILPDYSFDPNGAGINEYCNNPWQTLQKAFPVWTGAVSGGADWKPGFLPTTPTPPVVKNTKLLNGILYRPRVPYTMLIMRRDGATGWSLQERRVLMLENISPILSIGVGRSFFTRRISVLLFRNGAIENVCVYKGSELVEAVKIPFVVASAIVALPATILQIKIDTTEDLKSLAEAEQNLADFQTAAILAAAQKDLSKIGNAKTVSETTTSAAATADKKFDEILANLKPAGNTKLMRNDGETFFGEGSKFFGCPVVSLQPESITGFPQTSKAGGH